MNKDDYIENPGEKYNKNASYIFRWMLTNVTPFNVNEQLNSVVNYRKYEDIFCIHRTFINSPEYFYSLGFRYQILKPDVFIRYRYQKSKGLLQLKQHVYDYVLENSPLIQKILRNHEI